MIELFILEREIIFAKGNKQWFRYWKLKRKYRRLKRKLWK